MSNNSHLNTVANALYPIVVNDNGSQEHQSENNPRILMHISHPSSETTTSRHNINLHNVMREIQPLVDTARSVNAGVQNAISMSSLLSRTSSQEAQPPSESHFIDMVEAAPEVQQPAQNNVIEHNIEAQEYLRALVKYLPFVMILLAKGAYDYHNSIFILIIMFVTFVHTNMTTKREIIKRHRRSFKTLCLELVYIAACIVFVYHVFGDEIRTLDVVPNLTLIRTFGQVLTVGNLLWIVTVTDLTLKLATVTIKIVLTLMPDKLIPFQRRGKFYLFIEASSQMYRSLATVQPWLNYFLEAYQGTEKIMAVFFSACYMISKGWDLMSSLTLLKSSFLKLLQNVTVGSSPSTEDIKNAGNLCPICHDDYTTPVLLQCKHIFCEGCVSTWFDQEQTCPLCRAQIVSDPAWRDGSTSYFLQLY